MALVDFLPVILFAAAVVILQGEFYPLFSKMQFAAFSSGGTMIVIAGLFKALYKLLYAADICDFERLNLVFFPLQATGFLIIGFAAVSFLFAHGDDYKKKAAVFAPPAFSGTMIFVVGMIVGVVALCGSLTVISAKMKKYGTMIIFILSVLFMLTMGYLSTKDFEQSYINWIAQGVNIVGEGLFLIGAVSLKRSGLKEFKF